MKDVDKIKIEKVQLIAVKNLYYDGSDDYDSFVNEHITSPKALELYYKLKKAKQIIK